MFVHLHSGCFWRVFFFFFFLVAFFGFFTALFQVTHQCMVTAVSRHHQQRLIRNSSASFQTQHLQLWQVMDQSFHTFIAQQSHLIQPQLLAMRNTGTDPSKINILYLWHATKVQHKQGQLFLFLEWCKSYAFYIGASS